MNCCSACRVFSLPKPMRRFAAAAKTLDNGAGTQISALEELIRWRLWERTGAGLMAELGSHQLDAASIFIGAQSPGGEKVYPLSVMGSGSRSLFPADREVDDHVYATFEFPGPGYYKTNQRDGEVADPNKKIVVTYSSINGNGFGGYGEVVLGTEGTLILEQETDVMLYKGSNTSTHIKVSKGQGGVQLDTTESGGQEAAIAVAATPTEVSRGYREQIEHWAWCVRNPAPENQPRCGPKVAMGDAVATGDGDTEIDWAISQVTRKWPSDCPHWHSVFSSVFKELMLSACTSKGSDTDPQKHACALEGRVAMLTAVKTHFQHGFPRNPEGSTSVDNRPF